MIHPYFHIRRLLQVCNPINSKTGMGVMMIISLMFTFQLDVKGAPVDAVDTLSSDGAWCWFADPRAVYHQGDKEQTYFGWITGGGSVKVAAYNHNLGEYKETIIHENLEVDDHANPSILIRDDGRIIVFYSKHGGEVMYRVISDQPEDISSFSEPSTFGKNATSVTYPSPFSVNDSIFVFYRGINWHPTLVVSEDQGETWEAPQQFIEGGGARPYAKYVQDSNGGIHIAFTHGHPRKEDNNKIYYAYYRNGQFKKADGTVIKNYSGSADALDIDQGEAEVVYDASEGKGWIWDIALDENENPVMVYAAFPSDTLHEYYYGKWNGTSWNNHFISWGGSWFPQTPEGETETEPNYSGGISLDHENTSVVYLSKPVQGVYEIFKYQTKDNGQNWHSSQITENTPEGILNVRPYVPRDHKPGFFDVIWMEGTYVHFTDYNTRIMDYSPREQYHYYDFGTEHSPVDSLAIGVSSSTTFENDFGFENTTHLNASINDTSSPAKGDFVYSDNNAKFKTKLFNGKYMVNIIQGDAEKSHDEMSFSANGEEILSDITTNAGEYAENSFEVTVTNNILDLEFTDKGGNDPEWVLNSIEINTLEVYAEKLQLDKDSVQLYEGDRLDLGYSVLPLSTTDKSVEWTSKNENLARVKEGKVTAEREGNTYIMVSKNNGELIDSCYISVEKLDYVADCQFDFGTKTSPVADQAFQVSHSTQLNDSYGWLDTADLDSRDRDSADAAKRDFVFASASHKFQAYVRNGLYHVSIVQGDTSYPHDDMNIYANGELVDSNISTQAGQFDTSEFDIRVEDKRLSIEFTDGGGNDANWVINSISISTKELSPDNLDIYRDSVELSKGSSLTLELYNTLDSVEWFSGDETIAGINNGEITGNKEGSTYVYVRSKEFDLIDSCWVDVVKLTTDIHKETKTRTLNIFPNPVSNGHFQVFIPEISEKLTLIIIDSSGSIVKSKILRDKEQVVIDESLPAGIYQLVVKGSEYFSAGKLVIQ